MISNKKNSTERDLVDGGKIFRNIKTIVKKKKRKKEKRNLQHPMKMSFKSELLLKGHGAGVTHSHV
jgi:hypothetical protein